MMWRNLLFLPLVLLATPSLAQSVPQGRTIASAQPQMTTAYDTSSVRQFLSVCNRDISGCDLEISTALLDKLNAPDATSVCMTDPQYETPVVAWLKDHSESWPMATEDGIYTAFKTLYPCS